MVASQSDHMIAKKREINMQTVGDSRKREAARALWKT